MKRGGQAVEAGYYWNLGEWEVVTVAGRSGGVLPGNGEQKYVKLPILLMLLLAPVMGALLVVFLPFVGFAMLLGHLGRLAMARARIAARLAAGRDALGQSEAHEAASSARAQDAHLHPNGQPGPGRRAA